MDSAFKRRWQFQYISADTYQFNNEGKPIIDHGKANDDVQTQANANIENVTGVTWDELRRSINNFLICNASTIRGIEDKQIGLWFIKAQANNTISQQDIQYKLMHYLWDNVFARDKTPLRNLLGDNGQRLEQSKLATFGQFACDINVNKFIQEVTKQFKDVENFICPTKATV